MHYVYGFFALAAIVALLDAISHDLAVVVVILVFFTWLFYRATRPVRPPRRTLERRDLLGTSQLRRRSWER